MPDQTSPVSTIAGHNQSNEMDTDADIPEAPMLHVQPANQSMDINPSCQTDQTTSSEQGLSGPIASPTSIDKPMDQSNDSVTTLPAEPHTPDASPASPPPIQQQHAEKHTITPVEKPDDDKRQKLRNNAESGSDSESSSPPPRGQQDQQADHDNNHMSAPATPPTTPAARSLAQVPPSTPAPTRHEHMPVRAPHPPTDQTIHTPARANEIAAGVDTSNIISTRRSRRPKRDPHFVAFTLAPNTEARLQLAFTTGVHGMKQEAEDSGPSPNEANRASLPPAPGNWSGLCTHPHKDGFIHAARIEIDTLVERGTFQVVDWPISKPVIPLKWVFTYKFDENGNLNKYKGRICVCGDLQPVSHEENQAATLTLWVFRMLMALVAAFDLETDQLDAINAFLNSSLDEEVYV